MADAPSDIPPEASKSPAMPSLAFSTPSEIPEAALTLLSRQMQLVAAAQSEIARGLQPLRNKDGKVIGTELGPDGATRAMSALIAGARYLTDVHELFAPRAQAKTEDRAVDSEAARALAAKLIQADQREQPRANATSARPRSTPPVSRNNGGVNP